MRNKILSLCLVLVLGAVALMPLAKQAWADIASLSQTTVPAAGDVVQLYDISTGNLVGINWSYMSRNMLQGVNWVGLNTTTGAINWNYVGQ